MTPDQLAEILLRRAMELGLQAGSMLVVAQRVVLENRAPTAAEVAMLIEGDPDIQRIMRETVGVRH